ncbi:MAG: sigma-54 dependent transcriptional regulator [Myxococcota bacterium]
MSRRVLLVDDDADLTRTLGLGLAQRGFRVLTASRADEALRHLDGQDVDVVVTDLNMPGLGGIEFCQRVSEGHPAVPVIVLTAFGSYDSAVAAIRAGAYDFLSKPARLDVIAIAVERAANHRALSQEVRRLRLEVSHGARLDGVVATSVAMQGVLDLVARVAATPTSLLITGESGTGKEVLARAIHQRSGRSGPFVAVDCAAMPESRLESELFGHARGDSTDQPRVGLFTEANGGTLLLNEVGELPLGLQPKLLRVLQERRVRPLGGRGEHAVDVRVIAATHRDLEGMVEESRFREDLFFRLNVVHLHLPPLRERTADILPLAHLFLADFAARAGKAVKGLSAKAAEKLVGYDWPGNVRELSNCLERAVALTRYDEVGVDDLPERVRTHTPSRVLVTGEVPSELVTLEEVEKRYILRVLEAHRGNKTAAARTLGIERKTLYRKLEAWGAASEKEEGT